MKRGERIFNYHKHHTAMKLWFEELNGPMAPGDTLSLTVYDGPNVYEAYTSRGNLYLVGATPDEYVAETIQENNARDAAHRAAMTTLPTGPISEGLVTQKEAR